MPCRQDIIWLSAEMRFHAGIGHRHMAVDGRQAPGWRTGSLHRMLHHLLISCLPLRLSRLPSSMSCLSFTSDMLIRRSVLMQPVLEANWSNFHVRARILLLSNTNIFELTSSVARSNHFGRHPVLISICAKWSGPRSPEKKVDFDVDGCEYE